MIPVPGPVAPPPPMVWSPTPWPRIFHFHGIYSILDAKPRISMVFAPVWMENLIFFMVCTAFWMQNLIFPYYLYYLQNLYYLHYTTYTTYTTYRTTSTGGEGGPWPWGGRGGPRTWNSIYITYMIYISYMICTYIHIYMYIHIYIFTIYTICKDQISVLVYFRHITPSRRSSAPLVAPWIWRSGCRTPSASSRWTWRWMPRGVTVSPKKSQAWAGWHDENHGETMVYPCLSCEKCWLLIVVWLVFDGLSC